MKPVSFPNLKVESGIVRTMNRIANLRYASQGIREKKRVTGIKQNENHI
jgi:hypothetical protein